LQIFKENVQEYSLIILVYYLQELDHSREVAHCG